MSVGVETFYGTAGPYLTRVSLGPLCIHVFHRGDEDEDPHDHRRAFVTFPLTSYVEEVYRHGPVGREVLRVVRAWRPHWRGRTFTHRVLGRWSGERDWFTRAPAPVCDDGQIATVVLWIGRKGPDWGFWQWPRAALHVCREFVPWREYLGKRGRL